MTYPAITQHVGRGAARARGGRLVLAAGSGAMLLAAAFRVQDNSLALVLAAAGATLVFHALFTGLRARLSPGRRALGRAADLVAADPSPCFVTDADGRILHRNAAAEERFGAEGGPTLAGLFRELFANPAAAFFRLQEHARGAGAAGEDVPTRRGTLRLAVTRLSPGTYLWRADEYSERRGAGRGGEGIGLPMMTVSASGTILFMNEAMRRVLGGRVRTLDRVFNTLPLRPFRPNVVAGKDGPVTCLAWEIEGPGGRRELYLLPGGEAAAAQDAPLFDELPVPLLRISRGGRVTDANRLARELLADPAAPGTVLSDLVEGLGRPVRDWLEDAFMGRGLHRPEVIRARRPEREVFLQITLSRSSAEAEPELVAVLTDATELKTLEAQFVQSQKMQAIGQLAGGVAHDFNNLLTAIAGHCDLMLMRHDEGDPDYGDLVQINENANRAASLVGQLLAFSRKQTLCPEVFDLGETLSELTHLLNRLVGEAVSLSLEAAPEPLAIRADRRQLEQVIMNLVVNARDAMPDGGGIRVCARRRRLDAPLRRDRAELTPGDYAVIEVSDEGVGIPPDKLPKIFEPFFTTKRAGEGTGLGLSMAYGIVKQSGGFIFADSAPDEGTTFTLYFPAREGDDPAAGDAGADAATPPASAADNPPEGGAVILLAEDEAPVRAFAARALALRGHTVLEAASGEEALQRLGEAETVDLFLTDVMMPGLDGPEWVRRALEQRPGVGVIFMSGYAEDIFGEDRPRIPNSDFLQKPFSLEELNRAVARRLQRARRPAASRTDS